MKKTKDPLCDISIPGFQFEQTPTEASKGGTEIYISEKLTYKKRNDLAMYSSNELESTFIEIVSKKEKKSFSENFDRYLDPFDSKKKLDRARFMT